MEELFVPLLQFVIEIVLEFLFYFGLDVAAVRDDRGQLNGFSLSAIFGVIGVMLGAIVTWIHPHTVLPLAWLRVANLIVAPFIAGLLSASIASWRQRRGRDRDPVLHFFLAFSFVLGFNLVRFAFARS